ncbi:MAG: 2,3-bisphosphoglycerate-independent phosphoglycerate mutase [Candidatus Diapherotrites archaeon]|nr:2,3-bisphosphoglycerate-independent phosphoglycerate mutase [Candidatus Diapherotrites archaeon]
MRIALIIIDGFGIAPPGLGNCISRAKTPFYDSLLRKFPHTELEASGNAVGLPQGAMGTSEVGHLHMGAGRTVWQPLALIDAQIKNREFYKNKALLNAMENAKSPGAALHLMGLCSDGQVHSTISHLLALLEMAKQEKVKKVFIHFFADGRDVGEKTAKKYAEQIEKKTAELGTGKIATLVGRFYSMDRDNNFDRTHKAFELLTQGKGFTAGNVFEAIEKAYARNDQTDYYIQPTVILENAKPVATINDNDAVVFFNTRTDRVRQLIKCFTQDEFPYFERKKRPAVAFYSFVQTDETIPEKKCAPVFNPGKVKNNLGEIISRAGMRQLRVAETEKYAHVTYFFNSQAETPNKNEERILVPSKKVPSYDMAPEMSAHEITEKACGQLAAKKFDFVAINYANPDLVGHSANIPAIVKAIEVVDACLEKVCKTAFENDYTVIVTSDHGNAEEKISPLGEKIPSHSTNPVPFILASEDTGLQKARLRKHGALSDIAPTIIELFGLEKPMEMTGMTLVEKIR